MASTEVPTQTTASNSPAGVTTSLIVRTSPGRVVVQFTVDTTASSTWTISKLQSNNGDTLLAVDDRLVWMTHGSAPTTSYDSSLGTWRAGNVLGVVAVDAVYSNDRVKTTTVTLDRNFFKWQARRYTLTWFLVQDAPGRVLPVGQGTYAFDLPPDDNAQYPMPQLVPGKILRGLFQLTTDQARAGYISAAAMKSVGINYVQAAIFPYNPADGAGAGTFPDDTWKSAVLARTYSQMVTDNVTNSLLPNLQWCQANGLYLLGEGDALYRNAQEQWWWTNHPQRDAVLAKVRDTLAYYRATVPGVWGMDETEFIPGFAATVSTVSFMKLWRQNPQAPPWCWPGQFPTVYEVPARADWSTRYVKVGLQELVNNLATDGRGFSLPQYGRMHQYMGSLCGNFPQEWARGSQFVCKPPNYRKLSPGDRFNPVAGDELIDGGTPPGWIPALCWLPLILHRASVLRGYLYDNEVSRRDRAGAPIPWPPLTNPTGLQVGVRPGYPEWDALGVGFRSIGDRESRLTSRTPKPPVYEDNWAYGGFDGLPVAVNCSPTPRPCPYLSSGVLLAGASQLLYRGGDVPSGGVVLYG
jgi:hypothetical protein